MTKLAKAEPLTKNERMILKHCEQDIHRGMKSFIGDTAENLSTVVDKVKVVPTSE